MLHPFRTVTAVVAGTLISVACASMRIDSGETVDSPLTLAGLPSSMAVGESPTESFALDRISKRRPRLTGTAKRTGTGRGVSIYVFDGGIPEHSELAGRVRTGFDAFPSSPRFCNPHGLAVAAAAAGTTLGVAPAAEIVDVKIINCNSGRGSVDAILAAARWTVADHRQHPNEPAVANWSFIVDTSAVIPAVDTALALLHDAGILVVASAGNLDIDACRVSPANSRGALVVGSASLLAQRDAATPAVARAALHDIRTTDTAWGDCIDVYAPGDGVPLPTIDRGHATITSWTGTSMAAGYVSGAASLVLEQSPTATGDEVEKILLARATPLAVDEGLNVKRAAGHARKPLLYVGPE